jgi:hypothetical protein
MVRRATSRSMNTTVEPACAVNLALPGRVDGSKNGARLGGFSRPLVCFPVRT